jgi:hypothetical protein
MSTRKAKPKAARMGRPPLPAADRLNKLAGMRLTGKEHAELSELAKRAGLTISEYLRDLWYKQRGT